MQPGSRKALRGRQVTLQGGTAPDERAQFAGEPVSAAVLPRPHFDRPARRVVWWKSSWFGEAFDHELQFGHLFLFVPICLALGALAYFNLITEPALWPMLVGAALFAVSATLARPLPVLRAVLIGLALVCTGAAAAKISVLRAATPMIGSEIGTRLTGRITEIERQPTGRVRLTLDVLGTQRPELRYAPDRIRATARQVPDGLRPGDTVVGVVRLMPASGPSRPSGYDFSFRSYFDGIGAVGFFLTDPVVAEEVGDDPGFRLRAAAWIEERRLAVATRIETTIGGPEGAIAAALITGIRAGIPEEINEALRVVGLYHVISISGLHMALVAGTLIGLVRGVFSLFPNFAMRHPVRKYSAGIALVATAFYLLMSGGDVAAQRSFLMLAVMLIALIFDRSALTMRNLALSAIVILLLSPEEVVGPSFQMSFAATAALIAAYAAWTSYRESQATEPIGSRGAVGGLVRKGMQFGIGLSMTSVIAGLATALFTAWHFQQVAPLGLVANLTAMPVVSVIIMPFAVFACLLMPFGLDEIPLQIMGMGIGAMNAISIWLAERSFLDATGAIPLSSVLLLTAGLAILTMAGSILRWVAAPLGLAGAFLLVTVPAVPDVLVSEDARLVAVRLADGRIAVNRARPRAFTMENWLRAFGAEQHTGPVEGQPTPTSPQANAFQCEEAVCSVMHPSGAVIVHVPDEASVERFCATAHLIIIDDATAENPCRTGPVVLTKRDLARRGSAEMFFRPSEHGVTIAIRHAVAEPYRPWHEHRAFSREARGMPPYVRPDRRPQPDASTLETQSAPEPSD
jgi:ComEC/Rec2-related protein